MSGGRNEFYFIFKGRVLFWLLSGAWEDWRENTKDLDARMCCDGRECGCMGSTYREMWGGHLKYPTRATPDAEDAS